MSSDGYNYQIKIDTNGNRVLPQLATNAKKTDTSIRGIGNNSRRSFGLLDRSATRSNNTLNKTRSILAGIGLTLSTGAIAAGLVSVGAGFEKSMSNVQALAGIAKKSNTEYVELQKSARDAGATTAFTARESADAMGYLAMAGYKTNQIIEALPATLDLAAAGNLGLARTADIATNILSQYRMKASDTASVVDKLAFTQSRFNTNIEEAADAMNYFGPTAAAMKISLSESGATIGLLANNGLKGSLGTRALSTSLVRLSKPTKQMSAVMKELNLDFYDAQGRYIGVANMVDQLNSKMVGLSDKQRTAAVSTIFGAEAIQEMSILLAEGGDKLRYWTNELDNADGTAKRMANTKLDNLAGDFQILKSTTQEFTLSLYDEMAPALRSLTKEATLFIRGLDTKQAGLMLKETVFGIRSGLIFLSKHKDTIIGIGKAMIILKGVTIAYNAGQKAQHGLIAIGTSLRWAQVAATRGATVATRTLNTAVMANPFGAILGAITAVVGVMTLFRDRTKEATAAQEEFNLMKDIAYKDSASLIKDTNSDRSKLTDKKLNQRQIVKLRDSANLRREEAEDMLLNIKSRAKTSSDYNNYLSLKKRENRAQVNSDWSGWSKQDDKRLKYLEERVNSIPEREFGISLKQLNKIISDNKQIVAKATSLIKEDPNGINSNSIDGIPGADKVSENIVSGGTSQRIINVTVEKFQDSVNFNVYGEIAEMRNKVEEMKDVINEALMRVLNSSNQLA